MRKVILPFGLFQSFARDLIKERVVLVVEGGLLFIALGFFFLNGLLLWLLFSFFKL